MKKIILTVLVAFTCCYAFSQGGTNSPYSQYGLGILSDQGVSFNKGMNGMGVAFCEHDRINTLNPASYANVDSLTFLFDVGMSLQRTFFTENSTTKVANNADFEYAVGSFRLIPHVGMAFGVLPYSNVGYNYNSVSYDDLSGYKPSGTDENYYTTNAYSGTGGLHEAFIGMGWNPIKNLSVGFNAGYLWGSSTKTVINSYSDASANSLSKIYTNDVSSYKVNVGLQYSFAVTKKDVVTVGSTYTFGHDLDRYPKLDIITAAASRSDTTSLKADKKLAVPSSLSIGLGVKHDNKLRLGLEYSMQKWSEVPYAKVITVNKNNSVTGLAENSYAYQSMDNMFDDRQTFRLGGEYCSNEYGRSLLSRVRYRFGASYTTPYLKINDANGPKEYSVSLGVGIPIVTGYNTTARNFSTVNISCQWVNMSMPNAIKENTFRINVGLTFNERWFAKWKFD